MNEDEELQRLIELAKTNVEVHPDTRVDTKEAYDFIQAFQITDGVKGKEDRVSTMVIFENYVRWRGKGHLAKRCFFKQFTKFFKNYRIQGIRYYIIKSPILKNNDEILEACAKRLIEERDATLIRKYLRNKYGKKKEQI